MPIYEYRCPRCGHELEVMQKVSEPAPERCPKCDQAGPLERLMSRTSFQLKGGGWYADLYGSKKKDSSSSSGPPATGAGGTTSSTPAPATGAGASSTSSPAPAAPAEPAKPSGGSSGSST